MDDVKMVTLRTGAQVTEGAFLATRLSLAGLVRLYAVAAAEILELARDPSHEMWGGTGHYCQQLRLIEADGTLHDVTREIVLASFEGEGIELRVLPEAEVLGG